MSYEISYNHISDEYLKRQMAIQDIHNWLGDKFGTLGAIAMLATNYRELSFYARFAGIRGYPVVALWDETREELRYMSE